MEGRCSTGQNPQQAVVPMEEKEEEEEEDKYNLRSSLLYMLIFVPFFKQSVQNERIKLMLFYFCPFFVMSIRMSLPPRPLTWACFSCEIFNPIAL